MISVLSRKFFIILYEDFISVYYLVLLLALTELYYSLSNMSLFLFNRLILVFFSKIDPKTISWHTRNVDNVLIGFHS